jgi:cell division protein FtsZ
MSDPLSSMLLVGIGGAGCAMARGVMRAFGDGLRYVLTDTDAKTGEAGGPFVLIGGDRLSGRGSGGDVVAARLAAEDSVQALDDSLEGVRLAVVVTALGGGTGGGATLEVVKHLSERGIPSCVFATTPFAFEGETRQRSSRGMMTLIEEAASACFFVPLDKLVGDADSDMPGAMRRAVDTLASGVTLFWRLVEKPGYIKLDSERIRHLVSGAGRGRFAYVSAQGPSRADDIVDAIRRSPLLLAASGPVSAILCGVLAGDDLRLSEIGTISDGLRTSFGDRAAFELATVNDEQTFSGRICVVAMLFESSRKDAPEDPNGGGEQGRRRRKQRAILSAGPTGRGRFNNAEPTIWNGEDLDTPTFLRKNISLEF